VICILGEPEDADVLWLAVGLGERGRVVEVVLPEELMLGSSLSYRIESSPTAWELRLGDGRLFQPGQVSLVVNRLTVLPPPANETLAHTDSTFISEEWRAAVVAFLRNLSCTVLNPPRAASLAGPVMSTQAWRAVAHAHGLVARPHRSDDRQVPADPIPLTCVGTVCIDPHGAGDHDVHKRLAAMAAYVGAPLLGALFDREGDRLIFCEASAFPPLRSMGDPLIDAIADIAADGRVAP
jgi:hypothetical protein